MKNTENKIRENVNQIFDSQPAEGHRERFAKKLLSQKKNKRNARIINFGYAASIAAAIIVALIIFKPEFSDSETENISWEDIRIVEVQRYYAKLLDNEINTTKELLQNIDETERSNVLSDIEMMKTDNNIIPNKMTDEEKAAVIVSVYSRKIESLQNLQNNLLAYEK